MSFQHLQKLLDAVPEKELQLGTVAGNKPGIFAGQLPVCRTREDGDGPAYAELIVEAVNALPALLAQATPVAPLLSASAPADTFCSQFRDSLVDEIANVLNMRSGAAKGSMKIWGRLIWMTVEGRLQDSMQGLGNLRMPSASPAERDHSEAEQRARLEAVLSFCCFLSTRAPNQDLPGSSELDTLSAEWSRVHNSPDAVNASDRS